MGIVHAVALTETVRLVIVDTMRVACDTARVTGRVVSENPKWFLPVIYSLLGTLAGALVGAFANYRLNRRIARQQAAQARVLFKWQREQAAAQRIVDLLLDFIAALGDIQHRVQRTDKGVARSRGTGRREQAVEALGELIFAAESALQASWNRLIAALVSYPGALLVLEAGQQTLGMHWKKLTAAIDETAQLGTVVREQGAGSFAEQLARLSSALERFGGLVGEFTKACQKLFVEVETDMQTRDEPTMVVDDDEKSESA